MYKPTPLAKVFFLAYAILAPISALLTSFNDVKPRPVEWGLVIAFASILIVLVAFLYPRLKFDESEKGLTSRRLFTIFALSFVFVGVIGFIRLGFRHLLLSHDYSIMFGVSGLLGLALLCAIGLNKRLTSR